MYLGAYTGTESAVDGIRLAYVDPTGMRCTDHVVATLDPSFLALAPDGRTLYAVNELSVGRVAAFAVRSDGTLAPINSQLSHGATPCHLSVHPGGAFLLTAHYGSGELVVHPIGPGGRLLEACHVIQHTGSGPNPRQVSSHLHQVLTDPGERHVLAVDLGTDSVYTYDFNPLTGHLSLKQEVMLRAGAGPRHLAFHPGGRRLYLINELTSTMTEGGYDPETGILTLGETISTLPADYQGPNLAAEVVVSADGRFVYGSNRGHDSIAVIRTDDFRLVGVHPAGVVEPRHIVLSPDGANLLVAGQSSENVQMFAVDGPELEAVGRPVPTPRPACLLPV